MNKGDISNPNARSRLVARQIRQAGEDAICAPTPLSEALRSIISMAATDLPGRPLHVRDPESNRRTQQSAIDISRADFNASTDGGNPLKCLRCTRARTPQDDRRTCLDQRCICHQTWRHGSGRHHSLSRRLSRTSIVTRRPTQCRQNGLVHRRAGGSDTVHMWGRSTSGAEPNHVCRSTATCAAPVAGAAWPLTHQDMRSADAELERLFA